MGLVFFSYIQKTPFPVSLIRFSLPHLLPLMCWQNTKGPCGTGFLWVPLTIWSIYPCLWLNREWGIFFMAPGWPLAEHFWTLCRHAWHKTWRRNFLSGGSEKGEGTVQYNFRARVTHCYVRHALLSHRRIWKQCGKSLCKGVEVGKLESFWNILECGDYGKNPSVLNDSHSMPRHNIPPTLKDVILL